MNLLLLNPCQVCCHLGTCLQRKTESRRKTKDFKKQRIQKYLENQH